MIVVDSSAVMAVLLGEPAAAAVNEVSFGDDEFCMAATTRLELHIVVTRRIGVGGIAELETWLRAAAIAEVAFTSRHREIAAEAFYRYGKGRHRAGLNFGDCMSYAVAADLDAPLLYVGDDFTQTDVRSALAGPTGSGA